MRAFASDVGVLFPLAAKSHATFLLPLCCCDFSRPWSVRLDASRCRKKCRRSLTSKAVCGCCARACRPLCHFTMLAAVSPCSRSCGGLRCSGSWSYRPIHIDLTLNNLCSDRVRLSRCISNSLRLCLAGLLTFKLPLSVSISSPSSPDKSPDARCEKYCSAMEASAGTT